MKKLKIIEKLKFQLIKKMKKIKINVMEIFKSILNEFNSISLIFEFFLNFK